MRSRAVLGLVVGLLVCSTVCAADLTSHLGNTGPVFEAGLTPAGLGWGADEEAYPDRFVVNPVDLAEMVWVPAGTFHMGSTDDEIDQQWRDNDWDPGWKQDADDEKPAHAVTISRGFWLYRCEVMASQYERFCTASGRVMHVGLPQWVLERGFPVMYVDWADADAYAAWARGALPTEAEWEWSARGPGNCIYPWGDEWDRWLCVSAEQHAGEALLTTQAWQEWLRHETGAFEGDDSVVSLALELAPDSRFMETFNSTLEVGKMRGGSWCGAQDLAGNMGEWCADWYGPYESAACTDPRGPSTGEARVMRGGSGGDCADRCRSASRRAWEPEWWTISFGFRVAVHVEGSSG